MVNSINYHLTNGVGITGDELIDQRGDTGGRGLMVGLLDGLAIDGESGPSAVRDDVLDVEDKVASLRVQREVGGACRRPSCC